MLLGFKPRFRQLIIDGIKKHTLREDPNYRWKPGMVIHFATGIRTKDYEQFKEGICKDVQKIKLKGDGVTVNVFTGDHRPITGVELVKFYQNDGFKTRGEFDEWFLPICEKAHAAGIKYVVLRLIHWTDDVRY